MKAGGGGAGVVRFMNPMEGQDAGPEPEPEPPPIVDKRDEAPSDPAEKLDWIFQVRHEWHFATPHGGPRSPWGPPQLMGPRSSAPGGGATLPTASSQLSHSSMLVIACKLQHCTLPPHYHNVRSTALLSSLSPSGALLTAHRPPSAPDRAGGRAPGDRRGRDHDDAELHRERQVQPGALHKHVDQAARGHEHPRVAQRPPPL